MIITEHIATNRNIIDIPLIFVCIGARNDNFDSWKTLGKKLRYYGFEPDKDECTKLNKKINDENVPWTHHYYPLALAKENGQRKFYVTLDPGCSSLYEPNLEEVVGFNLESKINVDEIIDIETVTLLHWAKENKIKRIDSLKLYVQGSELDILEGGGDLVTDCLAIELEVEFIELYKMQPLFADIDQWMKQNDYFILDLKSVKGKRKNRPDRNLTNGQVVWGDALYFKKIDYILLNDNNSKNFEKLINMILIADHYSLPDYSVFILNEAIHKYRDRFHEIELEELKLLQQELDKLFVNQHNSIHIFKSLLMKLFNLPGGWRLKRALGNAIRLHNLRNLNAHSKHFWRE